MKITSFLALGLLSSASAFAPVHDAATRTTTALSMETTGRAPNGAIKVAAQGMSLLKPIFQLEAQLQAAALGAVGQVDKEAVAQELATNIQQNKVLIYTYGLSPFSTEAVALLEASGYEFTKIELGAEWFLLGGAASETRVALADQVDNGATSLPKIFIGGNCIGGCAELAALVESDELDSVMKKGGASKKGETKKATGLFSFFN